jgi:hypothetical protein
MAKGQQRTNKETKKPKKDTPVKVASAGTLAPPINTALSIERGKKKKP